MISHMEMQFFECINYSVTNSDVKQLSWSCNYYIIYQTQNDLFYCMLLYLYLYMVHCYIPEMVILQQVRERGSNLSRDSSADLNASTLSHLTKESLRWFQYNVVLTKNEFLYWSVLQDGTVKPLLLLQTDLLAMFMVLKSLKLFARMFLPGFLLVRYFWGGMAGTTPSTTL